MFVVNTLAPLLDKPFYPKGIDDGVDHTSTYIDKLKFRKNLRCKGENNEKDIPSK